MAQTIAERPLIGVGTLNISDRGRELVMDALLHNRLSYGPYCRKFESEFAKVHGVKYAVLSNSGTSALHVALAVMKEMHGWADGDEVLVPAVTFVATVNIVLHNRMTPVLVDVDPLYYEMDPALIEQKITPRTRAIIPVHLFGQPADMQPIQDVARRHRLKIIEDSAETMFARYRGTYVGGLGDMGCFSTYIAHLLTTGVGGFTTTNNPDYAVRLRSLVNHGRDSIYISIDDDDNLSSEELKMVIARRFSFVSVGHSFRVTEMEAALGVAQLEEWTAMIAKRRANAAALTRVLADMQERMQLPAIRAGNEHSFMMYPIVLRDMPKSDLVNWLEQRGIETRDMLPLTNQPVYNSVLGVREDEYPVAQWINTNGFYIGSHQDLTDGDIEYMAETFRAFWKERAAGVRTRPSATLVLVTNAAWQAPARVFDDIPLEYFEEVVVINAGSAAAVTIPALADGIAVRQATVPYNDVVRRVIDGTLPIGSEYAVFFVADGRQNAAEIGRLLMQVMRGYDLVVGSRFMAGGARWDTQRTISLRSAGNRFFTFLANMVFPGNLSDALHTLRAVRLARLREVQPETRLLAAMYRMSLHALRCNWRVAEAPSVEYASQTSRERRAAYRSTARLLWVLFKEYRLTRRKR